MRDNEAAVYGECDEYCYNQFELARWEIEGYLSTPGYVYMCLRAS